MQPIVWTQNSDQRESLALALRAILAGHGVSCAYEELVALLGLGAAVTADPDECIAHWPQLARDAALRDAAEVCGLRLRDLHPPDAAVGLAHSAEFPQHFIDSYVPLIRRAIDHGQPVLAWGGWETPGAENALLWGVLHNLHENAPVGRAPGAADHDVPLLGPARQVYVVEEYDSGQAALGDPGILFAIAVRAAQVFWSMQVETRHGVRSGEAAYRALIAAAECAGPCPGCRSVTGTCIGAALRSLISSRRAQATWLRRIGAELGRDHHRIANQWSALSEHVVDRLLPFAGDAIQCAPAGPRSAQQRLAEALYEISAIETAGMLQLVAPTRPVAPAGC